jgi:hypothetical protein
MTRCLLVILSLATLVAPLAADAQGMKNVPRIGVLSVGSPPASPDWKQQWPFLQGLRQLGWVEGQNITIEYRWASESPSRLAALAAELVDLEVDVIVAPDTQALSAVMQATTTIPTKPPKSSASLLLQFFSSRRPRSSADAGGPSITLQHYTSKSGEPMCGHSTPTQGHRHF